MKILLLFISCILFMGSCVVSMEKSQPIPVYRKISAEEAWQMMESSGEYILLDVRTEAEYRESHIKGAILIPDFEISARALKELPDKDMLIFVYCRRGRRSENAARELVEMGYTNVYDIGGIVDWPYGTINN